jgi:carboxyl-terminal processing protease
LSKIFRRLLHNLGRVFSYIFNIKITLKVVVALLIILVGGTYFLTSNKLINAVGGESEYDEAMRYIEIKDILDEKFIDTVDRSAMGDSAASAMVSSLGDKWSYFMSADEYKTYQLYSSDEYSDIGMSIKLDENTQGYQVISINSESPAALAGLTSGMVITGIDGQSIIGKDLDEVRTMIRARLNTLFVLEISGGDPINVDCSTTHTSSVSYRLEKTEAGYVKIDNFEAGSGQEAVDAIEKLLAQKAVALVIDVRNNPGGLKEEVATLLDYLLPKGVLFYEVDKEGHEEVTESDGMCVQLPMVVLVNSGSYSEAEIFAAVIQEYDWGLLMGEPTTGRTRIQSTVVLEDGSAIRLSTKAFLTPNRVDLCQSGGVVPDTILFNSDESATGTTSGTTGGEDGTSSTSNDDQLMAALKYLS